MPDIFDEVAEDLRRQKFLTAWRNYGKFLIAAVVLVVVGVAAYEYQKYHKLNRSHADSADFAAAVALLDAGKVDDGLAGLARLQESGGAGYRFLAGVRQAQTQARLGDTDGAIKTYEKLAADGGTEQALRDFAELQAIILSFDAAPPGALRDRLERLALPNAAWAPQAEELLALDEIRAGDAAAAKERLERLAANQDAPNGLRARAEELLATLSVPGSASGTTTETSAETANGTITGAEKRDAQ